MNMYSTFDSPRFYYFISHVSELEGAVARSSPDPILVKRRWWTYAERQAGTKERPIDAASSNRLQALGVRYVLQPEDDEPRPPPMKQFCVASGGRRQSGQGNFCISYMNTVIPMWEITVLQMW